VFDGALRQVQSRDVEHLTLQARRRNHHEQFAAHAPVLDAAGRERACIECHVSGEPPRAGEEYTGLFRHAQHVAVLAPGDSTSARTASTDCSACHAEITTSFHLTGRAAPASDDVAAAPAYLGPALQSCAQCHKDENGTPLVARVEAPAEGVVALRADFPHALHVDTARASLADGCFACHVFEERGETLLAHPMTKDARATSGCLPCHDTHASIGGDGCALCHPDTTGGLVDLAYLGPDTQDERAFVLRPRASGFSHDTRGHDGGAGGCLACHTGADSAATIREVHVPDEPDPSCWKCHVEERQQFHWRGAPAGDRPLQRSR
jgi:hypothetical protein